MDHWGRLAWKMEKMPLALGSILWASYTMFNK